MSYSLSYDSQSRLVISDVHCTCPLEHKEITEDIYVGEGIAKNIPAYIRKRNLGTRCTLVADTNTWALAGERIAESLTAEGFDVNPCVIRREGVMDPDESAVGEVLLAVRPQTDFLVSVGSGSLTDITRVNATRLRLPQVCVGTAPSMDGYTSAVCPLILHGCKIHREGKCPEIIVCDIDILKTAPLKMVCSGVGDVLGKYIAKADWMISALVTGETYCPVCGEIVTDAVEKLLDNIDEIKSRSAKGIRILTEALLLSGMTISIIGNTRAVASVEHNIAHYWEMMQLIHGKKPPMHGSSVGVATLLAWPLFLRFADEDISHLDLDKIKAQRITREERVRWMKEAYEEEAANSIMRDNPGDFLTWEEQKARIEAAQAHMNEIRSVIASLPPLEKIRGAMERLGSEMTPEECGIDTKLLNLSMHCAKDYRTRYTLFKTLDELGLLKDYLADYPL